MPIVSKHNIDQVGAIAYSRDHGNQPGVVFLCGHGSDMNGSKAACLHAWAQRRGQSFLRFDYSGHGQSDGDFLQTNISDWTRDTIDMIDAHTDGPQILVGSSLGGWIMLNAALARPARVAALVGIAAAPDFTEDLIWTPLDDAAKADFKSSGQIAMENPYADSPVIYPYHLINAVCMPAVLQFNKAAIEKKLSAAANYLYLQGGFDGFCAFVDDLNASLQIPKTLNALGIADIDIDRVVAGALSDPSTGGNPVEMTPENTRELLLACC